MGYGIVGFGYMGQMYADLIAAKKGELVGVHDIDPAKFKVGQFFSQRLELITHPKVATVIICTPHQQHLPLLKECLAHKKNVILEKPMGSSEAETDEIYREIRKFQGSSVVVVNITHCFYDQIIRAKQLLSDVDVNAITSIADRVVFPIKEEERNWWLFKKDQVGHGVLLTNGCHLLARILFIFARHHPTFEVVGGVFGNTNRLGDIEDSVGHMRLNLLLSNGRRIPVSIFAHWPMAKSVNEAIEESMEVRTNTGKWHIQAWNGVTYHPDPAKKISHQVPYHRETIGAEIEKGVRNVFEAFEQAVAAKQATIHESVQHTYQAEKAIATLYTQFHKHAYDLRNHSPTLKALDCDESIIQLK